MTKRTEQTLKEYKEQSNENYKIWFDFINNDTSVKHKLEAISMVDKLNLNHKVVGISATMHSQHNPISVEVIHSLNNAEKYPNFYGVYLTDLNPDKDYIHVEMY